MAKTDKAPVGELREYRIVTTTMAASRIYYRDELHTFAEVPEGERGPLLERLLAAGLIDPVSPDSPSTSTADAT